jgi:hypothetical protein
MSSAAHSCKHCQCIVLRSQHFQRDSITIKLPHTAQEIREALKDGCVLFQVFCCSVSTLKKGKFVLTKLARRSMPDSSYGQDEYATATSALNWYPTRFRSFIQVGSFYIQMYKQKDLDTFRQERLGIDDPRTGYVLYPNYGYMNVDHEHCRVKASPGKHHVELRPGEELNIVGIAAEELPARLERAQNPYVSSDSSMSEARRWLLECHSTHDRCFKAHGSYTPGRLICIESGDGQPVIRLVENVSGENIKWAALSYVWGGDQVLKATSSSLLALKENISVGNLPRTLRDAVTVCIKLGLTYLWVDCLCIIQDDQDDLTRELANMPQIYQRAWVTISASTARHVSEGFLHDRQYRSGDIGATSLTYLSKDGISSGAVIVGETSPTNTVMDKNLPIHHRAWYAMSKNNEYAWYTLTSY